MALAAQPKIHPAHLHSMASLPLQLLCLLVLAIPIASISWTVTHEEVFREPRDYCKDKSESCRGFWQRKFFYLFTCEYCFSHYIAAVLLAVTHFTLLYSGWRGYLVSFFALVWGANIYMAGFANLRLDIRHERIEIQSKDLELRAKTKHLPKDRAA